MRSEINPKVKEGDRIILFGMYEDSNPVDPGTKGTVTGVQKDPFDPDGEIIMVKWDNGSTLSLLSNVDVWKKVND